MKIQDILSATPYVRLVGIVECYYTMPRQPTDDIVANARQFFGKHPVSTVLKNKAAQLGLDVHHQGGFGSGFDAEGDIEFSTDYLGKDLVKAAKHCLHLQEVFATLLNDYERSMSAIGIGDGFKETTVVVRLVSPDVDGTNGMDLAYWDGLQEIIAGTVDLKELLRRTETGDVI